MPNRILKESIWRSESLNQCSLDAQAFFMRLIPYPDDFGRFDARLPIIRATLYPLKYAEITEKKIEGWMNELCTAAMIRLYEVSGVRYGYFVNWNKHQQQRVKRSKYPDPPPDDSICNQMISDDGKCCDESNPNPIQSESNPKYSPNSDEVRMSELLFSLIQARDEKTKKPDFQKWAVHIDRLMRIDNRGPTEVKAVIEWCQGDTFWQNNILSTEALRNKFSQLVLKMRGRGNGTGTKPDNRGGQGKTAAKSDGEPYPVDFDL